MAGLGNKFAKQLFRSEVDHKPFICKMLCKNYLCSILPSNQKRPWYSFWHGSRHLSTFSLYDLSATPIYAIRDRFSFAIICKMMLKT